MKRMKHPIHGFHCPQGSEESEMRKNGWVDDVPEPVADVAVIGEATQDAPVKRQYNRKANK